MPSLNAFQDDVFGMVSMTAAVNKLPHKPMRIGELNLFKVKGITTTTAMIEERSGKLSLIPTAARGTMPNSVSGNARTARALAVPHIPLNSTLLADSVQGVRAFGSETELEVLAQIVNERLTEMKDHIDTTLEYHRVGAIKGTVLDADGSTTLYDLFTTFGLTQSTFDFDFSADDIRMKGLEITRAMEDALGSALFTGIHAMCGNNFFDQLLQNAEVAAAYELLDDNRFARDNPAAYRLGFEYGGIMWWNYRGQIGNVAFVDSNSAHFYPVGVPDLFDVIYAPAPFMETVNTVGKPFYAKQRVLDFDLGVELHVQSNPLHICTRPGALLLGTNVTPSSSA